MNGVYVTLAGTVATRPEVKMHNGVRLVSFRMVARERRFDKASGSWVDGAQTWATVTCWRSLAVNVESSVLWKDKVVVHGRMRTDQWMSDGARRSDIAVTADTVGHDLSFGTSVFTRRSRQDDEALAARDAETELARRVSDLPVTSLDDGELEPPYDVTDDAVGLTAPDGGPDPDDTLGEPDGEAGHLDGPALDLVGAAPGR